MAKKEYKVIEILNKKELLINYGSNDGAVEGTKLIISTSGPEVIDPETKEVLGTLDIIKEKLEIYTVYPNFSICRNTSYEQRDLFAPFNSKLQTVIVSHELNVSDKDISGRWPINVPPVKIGDIVKII